jgi:outer membrane protein assembly factor BamB
MKIRSLSVFLLGTCLCAVSHADDWPQWMGPERDNVWREEGIVGQMPVGGPKVAWRAPVAGGYAGPAVADGRVFVTDYVTDENVNVANFERKESSGVERVLCLDEATGKELWKFEYPVKYTISYPCGPRCTPAVADGKVYTLGSEGTLYAFDAKTGNVLWSHDFNKEYGAKTALWGYSGHPLVDGNKLICIVGGEGSFVVAFDKDSGKETWKALNSPDQGYSPPAILEIAGQRQLVLLRPDAVTALVPDTGEEIWSVPYESDNGLVVMTPVVWNDYMFVGGYSDKNMLIKLAADGKSAEMVWNQNALRALSPINVQPALDGDVLYGFDQNGRLYGIQLPDGDRLWNTSEPLAERPPRSGTAFIIRQGDRYWLFTENGDLILANLSPEGYKELGRAHVLDPTGDAFGRSVVWCSPAFANRRMYVRNDKECIVVDLAAE